MLAASGDPRCQHLHIVWLECNEVGAISARQLSQSVLEAEEGRRMRRGEPQRIRQRNAEQANAIAHGGGHIEHRPSERSLAGAAATVPHADGFAVQAENRAVSTHGRHRVGHQHGTTAPAQHESKHGWIDVRAINDNSVRCMRRVQRLRDRPRLAAGQRPHRVEEMRKAAKPLSHCSSGLLIGRHGVTERDASAGRDELLDEAGRHDLRRQGDEERALARRGQHLELVGA